MINVLYFNCNCISKLRLCLIFSCEAGSGRQVLLESDNPSRAGLCNGNETPNSGHFYNRSLLVNEAKIENIAIMRVLLGREKAGEMLLVTRYCICSKL